jgi:glycosyltransferase involved in cell wall biosynthesis
MLLNENPLVSIIIPCFNYEDFVGEAIHSAAQQTYPHIEIIVINDGSTDGSESVIESLRKNIDFTYHAQDNQGIVHARNKGVELASGDFLVQLDADDCLDPDYVEKLVTAAIENECEIAYAQCKVFGRVDFVTLYPYFDLESLKHDNFINCSALVHKSLFDNQLFDVYLNDKGNEDWDFFLGACLNGARGVLVDDTFLHYRKHDDLRSRADQLESAFNEYFVRHYILEKYNKKHPESMGYFATEIRHLSEMKKMVEDIDRLTVYEKKYMALRHNPLARAAAVIVKPLKSAVKKVRS